MAQSSSLVAPNRHVDLLTENVDIAFRITDQPPQTKAVTSLGVMEDIICAAPSYLSQHPHPLAPQELTEHECLLYLNPTRIHRWTFRKDRHVQVVEVKGQLAFNHHSALRGPLLNGSGIAKLPEYFVARDLQEGKLVRLFKEFRSDQLPIYLLHQELSSQPPRVRAFVSFAQSNLGATHLSQGSGPE